MFARVSTFTTGPETTSDAPSEDVVNQLLDIPGCLGMYYFTGRGTGKDLAFTLWESEEAMIESREAVSSIRTEVSAEEKREIAEVDEYEVTVSNLKG